MCASVDEVVITDRLTARQSRQADWERQSRVLERLIERADDPDAILDWLATAVFESCGGVSTAGVSLLEPAVEAGAEAVASAPGFRFRWAALAGTLASRLNRTLPRAFSPCGTCLDRGAPQLLLRPGRRFTDLASDDIFEHLLVPFRVASRTLGAVWVASHEPGRCFDGEDVRLLTALAATAAVALSRAHARRRREEECLDLFANAPVGLDEIGPDGRILRANDAQLALMACPRGAYVGHHVAHFCEDPRSAEDMLARLRRDETLREYPMRIRRPDGAVREILVDANVRRQGDAFASIRRSCRDATETRARDEKLRFQSLVLENVRDSVIVTDLDGLVVEWNQGAEEIFGYSAAEMIGKPVSLLYPEGRGEAMPHDLAPIAAGGELRGEWKGRAKDGKTVWIDVRTTAMLDERGQLVGFVGVAKDITARKEAERAAAAAAAAQEESRRKDEFLAMLGHELRNPLAPILTALQVLELRGEISTGPARAVIERQVRHMIRLVDDLLDVSRVTRGKLALDKERVMLSDVVAKAIETSQPLLAQRRHHLHVDQESLALPVEVDPMRMAQVFANLLNNAAKYTEPGGTIEIGASPSNDGVVVRVKDNGMGLSAELTPQLFEPFVQGRRTIARSQGGLGLGLNLARHLVQLHGGTIQAESPGPGQGSTFSVIIPIPATCPRPQHEAAARPAHSARQ